MELSIPQELTLIRGLSEKELQLLADIASFKEYYRPRSAIAKMLNVTIEYVSMLLKRLRDKGLIEKCGQFYNRVSYKTSKKIRRLFGHKVKNDIQDEKIAQPEPVQIEVTEPTPEPQDEPKNTPNDLVPVGDSDLSFHEKNPNEIVKSKTDLNNLCNDLMNYWNNKFSDTSVPKVTRMTSKRITGVKNRLKDKFTADELYLAIDKAHASSFCTSGKWGFAFDWIFCYNGNIIKVLEGNYDDKKENDLFGDLYEVAKNDPSMAIWFDGDTSQNRSNSKLIE